MSIPRLTELNLNHISSYLLNPLAYGERRIDQALALFLSILATICTLGILPVGLWIYKTCHCCDLPQAQQDTAKKTNSLVQYALDAYKDAFWESTIEQAFGSIEENLLTTKIQKALENDCKIPPKALLELLKLTEQEDIPHLVPFFAQIDKTYMRCIERGTAEDLKPRQLSGTVSSIYDILCNHLSYEGDRPTVISSYEHLKKLCNTRHRQFLQRYDQASPKHKFQILQILGHLDLSKQQQLIQKKFSDVITQLDKHPFSTEENIQALDLNN